MVMTDEQLVALALKKNEPALTELIKRYLKLGYFIAYQCSQNQTDAEDIVQEIFVKIWQKLNKFDSERKFKAWFYEVAKNTALDYIRKRKEISFTEWEQTIGQEIDNLLFKNEVLSSQIDQDIANQSLQKATLQLPEKYYEVLDLHHKQDMNFRQIATQLGESINTVKSRYRRALQSIKGIIGPPKSN